MYLLAAYSVRQNRIRWICAILHSRTPILKLTYQSRYLFFKATADGETFLLSFNAQSFKSNDVYTYLVNVKLGIS